MAMHGDGSASTISPGTTFVNPILDGTETVASAASAVWQGIYATASTATVTGGTNITTATGFNLFEIARPTITSSSALTVTNAATVYIANSPLAAGSTAITNAYSLWVDAGTSRFDGTVQTGTENGLLMPGLGTSFSLTTTSYTFNSTRDDMLFIGYNNTPGQPWGKINTSEPMLVMGFEANYNTGAANLSEVNLDWFSSGTIGVDAVQRRTFSVNINRATNAAEVLLAGTTIYFAADGGSTQARWYFGGSFPQLHISSFSISMRGAGAESAFAVRPSPTNTTGEIDAIPNGTPGSGYGSVMSLWGTDYQVDAVNTQRLFITSRPSDTCQIMSVKAGTGTARAIDIGVTTTAWQWTTSNHYIPLSNGSYNIGATGSRVKNVYVFNSLVAGGGDDGISLSVADATAMRTGSSGTTYYLDLGNVVIRNGDGAGSGASLTVSGTSTLNGNVTLADTANFVFNTSTGTKIGTATNQKLAFYNAAPVAQQTGVAVTALGVHTALVNLGLITS